MCSTHVCTHTNTHTLYCMHLRRGAHTPVRAGSLLNRKREWGRGGGEVIDILISIHTNSPLISLTKGSAALFSRLPPFESQCSGLSTRQHL